MSESEIVESESEEEPITFEAIQKQIQDWVSFIYLFS